jgi:hypothetical protein
LDPDVNHCPRISRIVPLGLAGMVVVVVVSGCQTAGQNDLVTRELRHQEDQIYAMEEYLAQYQQLLCQVRAENAALRRQIREGGGEPLPGPDSPGVAPLKSSQPERESAPKFQAPGRTAPSTEKTPPTDIPEVELIEPDVPPLEETTSNPKQFEIRGQNPPDAYDAPPAIVVAAAEAAELTRPAGEAPHSVLLQGEVVSNDSGGGPRLVVDVVPLAESNEPTAYDGELSLMVLRPSLTGPPHSLARWDFTAADARAAAADAGDGCGMRFHVELPAEVPLDGATELWVRLLPADGSKVLADVPVDFRHAGRFSSRVASHAEGEPPIATDPMPSQDVGTRTAEASTFLAELPVSTSVDDAGWTIARPVRPGEATAHPVASNSTWRAATRPIPMATSVPAGAPTTRPKPSTIQQAAFVEAIPPQKERVAAPGAQRDIPVWTPDRGGEAVANRSTGAPQSVDTRHRPSWSPLR